MSFMIELSYFMLQHFYQGVILKILCHFVDSEINHIRHSIKICQQNDRIQMDRKKEVIVYIKLKRMK